MTAANRPSETGGPAPQAFLATGDATAVLAERTAAIDRTVTDAAARLLLPADFTGIAVLAVGGYGRRQLFPHSDVDLLLLFESDRLAASSKEAISPFLQHLWDARMRVSHSVRTPAECVEVHDQNTELNISLLDHRYLAGDRNLYGELARRLPRFIHGNRDDLIRNLSRLTRERHEKFAGTLYHLEPNVKDTPGGLRDFQLVCWLEQLRTAVEARMSAAEPPPELQEAFRFLARIRCFLHFQAGRDLNNLTFAAQDSIAEQWQQGGPEALMRMYYRQARAVFRAAVRALEHEEASSSRLFAQFRDWRSRVANADFSVHHERAHFRAPQKIDLEPAIVLSLFEFTARHGIRPSQEAEQQIEARRPRLREYFRKAEGAWPALRGILSLPHAPLAVRAMHETGVAFALFPELETMECQVVRDFYHRYTVDEHTLVAMQTLSGLRGTKDAGARPYGDLLAEIKDPALLLFALWFHDTGKGSGGERSHVDGSLDLVQSVMERLKMPHADREMVCFLIGCHLEISQAMHSRDMHDPLTVQDLAHRMETVEHLKALTLVTYCDISAVNPAVMTPWRSAQLWQLYLIVYNELTRELESERIETLPEGPPERVEFLQGFPTRYLRTHGSAEIDEHMALEERSAKQGGVAVDIRKTDSAWQMTLIAADRPGLFASAAGTLSSFGLNILKAEAFSNWRGMVLDTFIFADENRNLAQNPSEVERLRTILEKVLAGKVEVRELLRNRPKPALPSRSARIPSRVSFDSESGTAATLIEIVAQDRPGLLYDLASAISSNGASIEVVLIDTQAHKAIDVFYVAAGGKKLLPEQQESLETALRAACEAV
jgi:[protein-PII] uridylyltransferase